MRRDICEPSGLKRLVCTNRNKLLPKKKMRQTSPPNIQKYTDTKIFQCSPPVNSFLAANAQIDERNRLAYDMRRETKPQCQHARRSSRSSTRRHRRRPMRYAAPPRPLTFPTQDVFKKWREKQTARANRRRRDVEGVGMTSLFDDSKKKPGDHRSCPLTGLTFRLTLSLFRSAATLVHLTAMNNHALFFHADTQYNPPPATASASPSYHTSATNYPQYRTRQHHQSSENNPHLSNIGGSIPDIIAMSNSTIQYYLSPKRRLDTLFTIHAAASLLIGTLGFLFPSAASVFFSTETEREFRVSRAILRPYCSLVLAQGLIIWRARKINDGELKRAFVQAYFVCFLLSTLSLINEHVQNSGVVSGKLLGVGKILAMLGLTAGYGWFTFFQPPSVFTGLGMTRSHYH